MKQHGGKREGAGRKPGGARSEAKTWAVRVSTEITKEHLDGLPSLLKTFESWDEDCKANPGNPRHYYLAKAVEELYKLGYLK